MFVKLIHSDLPKAGGPFSNRPQEFTMFANVARVEFTRVQQPDESIVEFAQIWCFGDPVQGFVTYKLSGDVNSGDHAIESVFVLNEEGKTIERYYPA